MTAGLGNITKGKGDPRVEFSYYSKVKRKMKKVTMEKSIRMNSTTFSKLKWKHSRLDLFSNKSDVTTQTKSEMKFVRRKRPWMTTWRNTRNKLAQL